MEWLLIIIIINMVALLPLPLLLLFRNEWHCSTPTTRSNNDEENKIVWRQIYIKQ